jgi:predicted TIM-barrel fold metal-dependent hydrolase
MATSSFPPVYFLYIQIQKMSLYFKLYQKILINFLGWVFVNPRGGKDQVQVLNKWKNHPGFIGVKAHPFWHRYHPIELLPVAEQLVQIGKPLLIHAGWGSHGDYDALLQEIT